MLFTCFNIEKRGGETNSGHVKLGDGDLRIDSLWGSRPGGLLGMGWALRRPWGCLESLSMAPDCSGWPAGRGG